MEGKKLKCSFALFSSVESIKTKLLCRIVLKAICYCFILIGRKHKNKIVMYNYAKNNLLCRLALFSLVEIKNDMHSNEKRPKHTE